MSIKKFTIIRDQQEKNNYWTFAKTSFIEKVKVEHLKTGDYILEGHPNLCAIERKGSVAEFAQNIYQKRFENELIRLETIRYPFVLLEFDLFDVVNYPSTAKLPPKIKKKIKVKGPQIIARLNEFQCRYKTKFMFVGPYGDAMASNIFKRVLEIEGML